jgi:hypothetical protein
MNSSRPTPVKLAIGCLVVIVAISLTTQKPPSARSTWIFITAFIFTCFFFLVLGFMIYRRKNWARWTFAVYSVIWLVWFVVTVRLRMDMPLARFIPQVVEFILLTCGVIMLFVPAANNWFRKARESA